MLRNLFHQIDQVLRPNEEVYTNRKYPISLKKLGQGDGEWSNRNTLLEWDLETIACCYRWNYFHVEIIENH